MKNEVFSKMPRPGVRCASENLMGSIRYASHQSCRFLCCANFSFCVGPGVGAPRDCGCETGPEPAVGFVRRADAGYGAISRPAPDPRRRRLRVRGRSTSLRRRRGCAGRWMQTGIDAIRLRRRLRIEGCSIRSGARRRGCFPADV